MRYPDSGGLSPQARAQGEALRLEAAQMFAAGLDTSEIAERLRVTRKSVNEWKRSWKAGGIAALASHGPGGARCRLSEGQLAQLEAELDVGPAGHGWIEDQRWTLARITQLIFELFRVRYTPRAVSYLLHRIGWSPQVPAHRAAERDEQAVATWVKQTWPRVKGVRPNSARGSSSPTSPASRSGHPKPAPGPGAGVLRSCGCAAVDPGGCPWPG
jgi:putative transposase